MPQVFRLLLVLKKASKRCYRLAKSIINLLGDGFGGGVGGAADVVTGGFFGSSS